MSLFISDAELAGASEFTDFYEFLAVSGILLICTLFFVLFFIIVKQSMISNSKTIPARHTVAIINLFIVS
jgi:hypothetical protein